MKLVTQWLAIALICYTMQAHPSEPHKPKDAASSLLIQNVLIGSMAGVTEICFLGQPLSYAMNQMVQGKPLASNPLHWYRGCAVNAAGMAPITAIQKAADAQLQMWVKRAQERELTGAQKMGTAVAAGALSAVASTPSEAIPVYMQQPENAHKTTRQAASELRLRSWRGFGPTAWRDGLFTMGYSALAPMMQERAGAIMSRSSAQATTGAQAAAGIIAGVATAVATQPLAVVKTEMQANRAHRNSLEAARRIYARHGAQGLFKGLTARGARVMVAIPVLTKASELYALKVKQYNQ